MIPRLIHFIWLGSPLPVWAKENIDSFKKHNPTWTFILWTDDKELLPEYREQWNRCKPNSSQQGDLLRLSILQKYSGWYSDVDCRCFAPLDSLYETLPNDDRVVTAHLSTFWMGSSDLTRWLPINRYVVDNTKCITYLRFSNTMVDALPNSFFLLPYDIANNGTNCLSESTRMPTTLIGHPFKGA